jgi:nitroreductase
MDVHECIGTCMVARAFRPDAIAPPVIRRILEAGRQCQSQRNRQAWHFIVVEDRGVLRQLGALASSGPFLAEAPLAIAVAMEAPKFAQVDAGRAVQSMTLAAWADGVASCYVGSFDKDKVKSVLGVPEGLEVITVLPFGYPARMPRGKRRRPLREIAHRERFGRPFEG